MFFVILVYVDETPVGGHGWRGLWLVMKVKVEVSSVYLGDPERWLSGMNDFNLNRQDEKITQDMYV